ncbi:WD repeat-containing protein 34 [Blastocladiella emersonii ATCC 22665]|nr:WD repeat-containing protein 34 [Blastocladiella emersonii ATCC 22665]
MKRFFDDASRATATVSVASTWRNERVVVVDGVGQTDPVRFAEMGCQSAVAAAAEVQTDNPHVVKSRMSSAAAGSGAPVSSTGRMFDFSGLAAFLQTVEAPVSSMLMENLRTDAFDDWMQRFNVEDADGGADSDPMTLGDLIVDTSVPKDLTLVATDRSRTGNSIVLAYSVGHQSGAAEAVGSPWCTHAGMVSVWQGGKKTARVTLASCATSVAFHPDQPSIVAIGMWPGDVAVWDTNTESLVSAVSEHSHGDAVGQVAWHAGNLWTCGLDGAITEWRWRQKALEPLRKVVLAISSRTKLGIPLRALALHPDPVSSILVASSVVGDLVHMDTRRIKAYGSTLAAGPTAAHFRYSGHAGAVAYLGFNSHVPLLLSAGHDKRINLYRVFRDTPVHTVRTPDRVLSAAWSPLRPAVFAATTPESVLLYDLAMPQPKSLIGSLKMACTGPVFFHPSLPLLYVAALESGRSCVRVVRLGATLAGGDMVVRLNDIAVLNALLGSVDDGSRDPSDD